MFKKVKPQRVSESGTHACSISPFPHCDQRILHAPGECEVCDLHPIWQDLRIAWGVAFTGYTPEGTELPCPADYARGDNHTKWGGNKPWTKEVRDAFKITQATDPFKIAHNHLGGECSGSCPMYGFKEAK